MTPPPPRRLSLYAAGVLALAFAAAADRPVAVTGEGAVRVEVAGSSVRLPAVPGLAIESVVGTAEGWVAAGTVVDGGLALFAGAAEGSRPRRLPVPPLAATALHLEPLPLLAGDGTLAGLAWLEGASARGLAVRFSRWDGVRWERPTTVSPSGAGSQLALAATALTDGTVLLAWSAFDGEDDEVMWSLWDGHDWSPPARIASDNRVPDITPALVAVDGGALAAWATYVGTGYQVVTSRFADGTWSPPRPVAPAGTGFPTFEPAPVAPRLLVRSALPRGWLVVELDGDGLPRRSAFAASANGGRPVTEDVGGAVVLTWPGQGAPAQRAAWTAAPGASR